MTSPPAEPTEAGVERRVSQAYAPAAAIARSTVTSIEGPVAAEACAAGVWHTHMGHAARPLRQRRLERAVASHGRHSTCPSCRDRDAQPAAHTWAAWRASSTSGGRGGLPRSRLACFQCHVGPLTNSLQRPPGLRLQLPQLSVS